MRKAARWIIAVTFLLFGTAGSLAQEAQRERLRVVPPILQRVKENAGKLDLSDPQRAKLDALFAEIQKEVYAAVKDATDREALRQKVEQITQQLRPGVQEILGAEQMARLRELMAGGGGAQRPAMPRPDTSKLRPMTELGEDNHEGYAGGLYPDGKNARPAAHEAAGLALAGQIRPLDAKGQADANGKIVLLSVGMSNTTQEFSVFKRIADAETRRNPKLLIVDGAQGGMAALQIVDPGDNATGTRFWRTVDERLAAAGASREQVQAAWVKQADIRPTEEFPKHARKLQAELARIVQVLHARFPNLKQAYLSSRTYGGYALTPLNPDPFAYEGGFAVNWLIEQQIKGDASLNYDAAKGKVVAPWLSWGPYLWANGTTRRADGFFFYEQSDFGGDGTHPSESGRMKGRGRGRPFGWPPAQIRTCRTAAYGSCFGCLA